jgi:moderate conductance mechanosensitive channel
MLAAFSLSTPTRVGTIVVVALLVTAVVTRGIGRLIKRLPATMVTGRSDQRTRTLTTVLRSTLIAAIWIVVVITLLSEAGVNLGAFVATATVVGGAVAFGAQTLVRDVIAGFFVLAEDQYGVGDVVDLGHATGTVERISLRSTRLRDNEGRVWWVPNGQIVRVANLTQGFANAVVDVPFPITAEVAVTVAALEAVVAPLEAEVLGVQELTDDRFILRVTARTEPGQQFGARRKLRAAIADAYRDGRLPKPAPGGTTVVLLGQPEPSESA